MGLAEIFSLCTGGCGEDGIAGKSYPIIPNTPQVVLVDKNERAEAKVTQVARVALLMGVIWCRSAGKCL